MAERATKILVVDDNDRVRDAMCSRIRLSSEGYEVDGVKSGREALERVDGDGYDVVLCDLVLPGDKDGIATTREISERHPEVRVVVFSGAESGDRKVQVLKAGAFSYLAKPINYEELLHAIETINRVRRTERLGQTFRTLARISHELQMTFDADVLAERIVRGARELGFVRARLYLYDPERKLLVGKAASGMDDDRAFEGYEVALAAHPMVQELFRADRPTIWNERRIVERYGEDATEPWMSDMGLHGLTWIDLPLMVGNVRVGTLAVDHGPGAGDSERYGADDLEIMEVFAGMAAHALNNAERYEKEALANASLSSILRDAPDAVVTTDLDGVITYVSPSTERLSGFPPEKLIGQPAWRFYAAAPGEPDGLAVARQVMARLKSEETVSSQRVEVVTASGKVQPASISMSLLHDAAGEAIGTLGIVKALGALEAKSEQYRDVLEGFGYGTLLVSRRGNVQFVNKKALRLLRRGREDTLGQSLKEMVLPAQRRELAAGLERVLNEGCETALDLSLLRGDTGRLAVSARLTPVRSHTGVRGVAVALYDKGELGALIQSGRLMALGQMVAGVAHEVNNPLNNMLVAVREMSGRLERDGLLEDKVRQYAEMIERNGQRIQAIVQSLRDFARPSGFERVELDLNLVIEDALAFFRTRFRHHNIEIQTDLAPDLPKVLGDPNRLQQVLVNLIVNAEDAMEPVSGPKRLEVVSCAKDGQVEVTLSDSGCGIPEEVMDAIFDPFFTTKAPSKGTGLGLSISKSIMDMHDGEIRAGRAASGGAAFTLTFPAV